MSAARYAAAGLLNTLVGFSAILFFELGVKLDAHLANLLGNGVGIIASYFLSRWFVFAKRRPQRGAAVKYALAVAAALAASQAGLALGSAVLPGSDLGKAAAQFVGVAFYSATLFLLSHFIVFADHPSPTPDRG